MGELLNSGLLSLASLAVSLIVMVVGLVIWFFVNRASSRTNEQIELLEAMLDLQKRQNALLRRLCEANEPEEKAVAKESAPDAKDDEDDFIRLVAER
ncbi:TPA: YebO family protein [Enterobacter cancerogenus]|uniref:YebO family protein n=1 Tax=Enterobacter sp. 2VL TaxID=2502206 RepID=UPI0010F97477|nr:YebO family protein [Enterobacter sp. 2VL]HDS6852631.1 YebO family protein [Enterobacter cancerogenus]